MINKKDEEKPQKVSFFKRRNFRYGSMATIFTAVVIVIIVIVNVVLTVLSSRFPLSLDLTTKQSYKLTSGTINFVKKVNADVKIYVLSEEAAYLGATESNFANCAKIMDQYPQYNSKISLQYMDLNKNPTFAAQYSSESPTVDDIIVVSGDKHKIISVSDLLVTTTDSTTGSQTVSGNNTEQKIDAAIDFVTTANSPTIMVTIGHGEQSSSALTKLLGDNNYTIETSNISTDGIDENASSLAIVAPNADFTSDEIKLLDTFLTNGGKMGKTLVVFFDPSQPALPNLEDYVAEWGLKVGSGAVYDKTNSFSTSYFDVIEGTSDPATVGTLSTGVPVDISRSRPISMLFETQGAYTTTKVLQTNSTAKLWNPGVITTNSTVNYSDSDQAGPFTVLAKSVKTESYNGSAATSNLLVSGSYEIVKDTNLTSTNMSNAKLILNTMNTLGGFKSGITIQAKDTTTTSISLTSTQAKFIEVLFICIIPIAVLALGIFVWLRRRHL